MEHSRKDLIGVKSGFKTGITTLVKKVSRITFQKIFKFHRAIKFEQTLRSKPVSIASVTMSMMGVFKIRGKLHVVTYALRLMVSTDVTHAS